ncbi:MAG: transcription antitermination factor NusB [bacterium]|nr:transcription antitermination factor NusB [bacterium]
MGARATGRKLAMQALYQTDLRGGDITEVIQVFLTDSQYATETVAWATELADGAWAYRETADQLIRDFAANWDLDRINPVDRNIMRLALFEIDKMDTPNSVVLNEAIEISKKYSTDESPKFINGILGKYVESCSQA